MKDHQNQKGYWFKPWLVGALFVVVLTSKATAAVLAEYALLLTLITVALIAVDTQPGHVVGNQLQIAAEGAVMANSAGNRSKEIGRLSKTIGAAKALMGMTASCDTCGDLRDDLQQIIGIAAHLKSLAVGHSGTCHPDGVIGPNEQCDPLATPDGCPISTLLTFCDDACQCEPVLIP